VIFSHALQEAQAWFQEKFDAFEQEGSPSILLLTGWPGVGKSTLLRTLNTNTEQLSYKSYYIDLDQVSNDPRYWQILNGKINEIGRQARRQGVPLCLFVDHVPPRLNEPLRGIENEILYPFHQAGDTLMLFVLRDKGRWGFNRLPQFADLYFLSTFSEEEINQLIEEINQHVSDPETCQNISFSATAGVPMLAKKFCEKQGGKRQGCEEYLRHWLERVDRSELSNILLNPQIYSLASLPEITTKTIQNELHISSRRAEKYHQYLRYARWIGWTAGPEKDDNIDRWTLPVQRCLELLARSN